MIERASSRNGRLGFYFLCSFGHRSRPCRSIGLACFEMRGVRNSLAWPPLVLSHNCISSTMPVLCSHPRRRILCDNHIQCTAHTIHHHRPGQHNYNNNNNNNVQSDILGWWGVFWRVVRRRRLGRLIFTLRFLVSGQRQKGRVRIFEWEVFAGGQAS